MALERLSGVKFLSEPKEIETLHQKATMNYSENYIDITPENPEFIQHADKLNTLPATQVPEKSTTNPLDGLKTWIEDVAKTGIDENRVREIIRESLSKVKPKQIVVKLNDAKPAQIEGTVHYQFPLVLTAIKDSKEYFNLHSLAFWLVSPSAFRRLWFRFIEQEDSKIQNNIGPCYGAVKDVPKKILDTMSACVYFPILRDNYSNYGDVIKNILEEFKA